MDETTGETLGTGRKFLGFDGDGKGKTRLACHRCASVEHKKLNRDENPAPSSACL